MDERKSEQSVANEQLVSLSEICEIRAEGCLSSKELLAVLVSACEFLNRNRSGVESGSSGLFSPESVFITRNGSVKIDFYSVATASDDFTPPELRTLKSSNTDEDVLKSLSIGDAQLVWCLGQLASQSCLPSFLDVSLISLLNLMTVDHVQTRPTLNKLSQMLRNRMDNVDEVPTILQKLYQELLGDIDDLIDDQFCDDIRFSSTRSSLSIVSGGAPFPHFAEEQLMPIKVEDFNINDDLKNSKAGQYIEDYIKASRSVDEDEEEKTDVEEDATTSHPQPHNSIVIEQRHARDTNQQNGRTTAQKDSWQVISSRKSSDTEVEDDVSNPFSTNYQSPEIKDSHSERTENVPPSGFTQRLNQEPVQVEVHDEPPFTENEETVSIPATNLSPKPPTPPPHSARYKKNSAQTRAPPAPLVEKESNTLSASDSIEPFEKIELPPEMLPSPAVIIQNGNDDSDYMDCVPAASVQPQPNFSRHNSLEPTKIQRRNSSKRIGTNYSNKLEAVPEFLEKNTLPLIRLRAQSFKKKKVTLHRSDNALVVVKLLNGQSVEVNCLTDAYVSNVFDTVAAHLNITEHLFFGLAMQQGSEYFFLDNDQRLEKTAPAGWKNSRRSFGAEYTLLLRFRYYPKKLEFIKTETTMHNLYLQLRHDMLSGSLRFDSTKAMELAAVCLQAEYSDYRQPKQREGRFQYFKLENYLPSKFYGFTEQNLDSTEAQLVEFHGKFRGIGRVEAERIFIERCQAELAYGAHYYRVYKIKPSSKNPYYNRYSDVHLIAIMPYGIGICREQSTGHRYIATTHEWHMIRTLQFDKKRFLIATIENNIAVDHVFYAEHYSKSSYLVRFAATQHRFMMKMRQWQSTLNRVGRPHGQRSSGMDVGVDVGFTDPLHNTGKETIDSRIHTGRRRSSPNRQQEESFLKPGQLMNEIDTDYIQYCYGSEAMKLTVTLIKHPDQGLGLTLVDGAVNGVKGVYVKSVSLEGDGKKKGLNIGDCLLSVNDVSLFNKTRHDAVELVKECESEVKLEVLRFPSITEVLATNNNNSNMSRIDVKDNDAGTTTNGRLSSKADDSAIGTQDSNISKRSESLDKSSSSLSVFNQTPTSLKPSDGNSPALIPKRQRAVSDFGAVGDTLPVLNSDDLLERFGSRRDRNGKIRKSGSGSSSSDDEGVDERFQHGEYNLPPVSDMYASNAFSDDEENGHHQDSKKEDAKPINKQLLGLSEKDFETTSWSSSLSAQRLLAKANSSGSNNIALNSSFDTGTLNSLGSQSREQKARKQQNTLDWTHDLTDIEDSATISSETALGSYARARRRVLTISMFKSSPSQSLGFQIASATAHDGEGRVFFFVKQINAEPAISANLHVDDIILSINGTSVEEGDYDHQQVVNLLRSAPANSNVTLEVQRNEPPSYNEGQSSGKQTIEQIVTVVLDKSQSRCIGLSLAKRMGLEGIFIRTIAVDSLAAQDGSLRVGDRIWEIDGENVADESPAAIVKRLKDIDGKFEIQVKRSVAA
ncbi:PDZ domain (Also known as DHR or GLGF) domain-containing protein [Ditylenchus destructor]|uniref:PDZ domain (Also known as DHR or GLGF) domain-containing protein n=1 Tax=Ditylenchus destructor TaxID=166010 RepID=A0AAD4MYV5_9BILA|nr:PDZ domain (Also known as DHR or GLGF) domain-containing protein [Ditylenchus destructor]